MKFKFLISLLLLPLSLFAVTTNKVDNIWIPSSIRISSGAPAIGKALFSDGVGFGTWQFVSTFTTNAVTDARYVLKAGDTMYGNLINSNAFILTGTNFTGVTNFITGSPGRFLSDNNGTNVYLYGSLKVVYLDDGSNPNSGANYPRAPGIGIISTGPDTNGLFGGDLTWANYGQFGGPNTEGRYVMLRSFLDGTTAGGRGGTFQVLTKIDGSGNFNTLQYDARGVLASLAGSGQMLLSNWHGDFNRLIVRGAMTNFGPVVMTNAVAFNDGVTIGDASSDSVIMNSGTMAIPNGLNIGSGLLVLSNSTQLVGIGTVNPLGKLHVLGNLGVTNLYIQGVSTQASPNIFVTDESGASLFKVSSNGTVTVSTTMFIRPGGFESGVSAQLGGMYSFRPSAVTMIGIIGRAPVGYTSDFIRFQNSATAVVFGVSSNGSLALGTNVYNGAADHYLDVWGAATIHSNLVSRGFGAVVSSISTKTNTLLQVFSGTYSGAPAAVTFGTTFAAVPTVVATTTTDGGTAILNDTIFATNITTTGCVIGYRTSAGVSSAATITFNGMAVGRQ